MSNFAELPPPTVPALSKTQIPLFRNPFYKDWPVILGLFAVASGAASNVGTSGNFLEFRPDDWAAFVVNIAFVAGVQGTIFGVIPALIRRKLNRRRVNFENKHEVFSNKLFWGLALIIAVTSALLVSFAQRNDDSSFIGLSDRRCEEVVEGTKCISATYLGNQEIKMQYSWDYLEVREVSGQYVSKITYAFRILCKDNTGYVSDLDALSPTGQSVTISEVQRSQMIMGLQTEVNQIVSRMC